MKILIGAIRPRTAKKQGEIWMRMSVIWDPEVIVKMLHLTLFTGCEMARLSFIASGGAIRNNVQDHQVYSKGAIMGLTREEALSKFEEIWAASPASVRMNWARKAMMSGATAGSQQAARQSKATEDAAAEARNAARRAANQRIIDGLETDQRFRDIEKKLR